MAGKEILLQLHAVINFFSRRKSLYCIIALDFSMHMEMSAWALALLDDGSSILMMGTH
jgi:hypothetical protein